MSPLPSIPVITTNCTLMFLADVGSVVTHHLSLSNVYFIPKLKWNLASIGQLCDSGDYLILKKNSIHKIFINAYYFFYSPPIQLLNWTLLFFYTERLLSYDIFDSLKENDDYNTNIITLNFKEALKKIIYSHLPYEVVVRFI